MSQRCEPVSINRHFAILLALLLSSLYLLLPSPSVRAATQFWLPTPPGETWRVVQGYACGTHDDWDRYSLDLVNSAGRTRGAPVRAAADGTIWDWVEQSGTLLVKHDDGLVTMYTHLDQAATTTRGAFVARGAVIGAVGDRGAPGTPHLHFTAFTGEGLGARQNRRSLPLAFADGYDLPEKGGCNQYGGMVLTAAGQRLPDPRLNRSYVPFVQAQSPEPQPAPAVKRQVGRIPRRWLAILCDLPDSAVRKGQFEGC